MKKTKPIGISLFAGAGGMSYGFAKAGFKILYANDNDKQATETYKLNFPETPAVCEDINNLKVEDLKQHIPEGRELDIIIGGPPCQGFSSAGAKWWDDPRNSLLKSYIRMLEGLRPRWFVMENVEGILTSAKGDYIHEFAKHVLDLGYTIRIHKLTLSHYGLPEKRKRVVVIGNRLGLDFDVPTAIHGEANSLFNLKPELSILDAIGDLVGQPDGKAYRSSAQNEYQKLMRNAAIVSDHFKPEIRGIGLERIKGLRQGQSMRDLPIYLQHPSYARRANRRVRDGMPTEKRGGAPAGLQRLRGDLPSKTITSASYREFIHPIEDRPLTIRECARIQSFPDSFEFVGSMHDRAKQIGNAVPPIIAEEIARSILNAEAVNNKNEALERGRLLGFYLTKSTGMSPALSQTYNLLKNLKEAYE